MTDWRPIPNSTNVAAAAEDGDDLLVEFHSGAVYRWPGSARYLDELLQSPSPGRFVSEVLRGTGERRE